MNISAILVVTNQQDRQSVQQRIREFPWAEVHYSQPDGRCLITIEGRDVDEEMAHLLAIKALPGVVLAEMIQHYSEPEGREE